MGLWGGATGSIFLTDEERGKKDDDHKAIKKGGGPRTGWRPVRVVQPRRGLRRLLAALLVGTAVYLFIRYIPTDNPIRDRRRPVYAHAHPKRPATAAGTAPKFAPPWRQRPPPSKLDDAFPGNNAAPETQGGVPPGAGMPARDYDGPVMFSSLAPGLHAIEETRGMFSDNRNVLFAAASFKSVSQLVPMACQMSVDKRNYVHFAVMSRSEIPIEELKAVNGVDESCLVFFHDARPDNATISTDGRLEYAVARALNNINLYMHPQAVIIDGSDTEELYFLRGMRAEAPARGLTLIDLPPGGVKRMRWIAQLDTASLKAWNNVHIDILIQAQTGAAGSLIRLLKSLSSADYAGCTIPHLTIELPQEVDGPTQQYLENFRWPPGGLEGPSGTNQLSLRHRIRERRPTIEENTIRFLESFWPTNPKDSHALVLSPQVELSPHYFHYLKYTILEYKHSNPAQYQQWDSRLMGISLELPTTFLDGKEGFRPPSKRKSAASSSEPSTKGSAAHDPFLWQAPSSEAVLYFGERWVELHGYVSQLLVAQTEWRRLPPVIGERHCARTHPGWLEHAAKLARARGYWMLYPAAETASNLAMVHNELYQPPEEFGGVKGRAGRPPTRAQEVRLAPTDLLDSLPDGGALPHFDDMQILAWDGKRTTLEDMNRAALDYAELFRLATGCATHEARAKWPDAHAKDLFCGE